MDIVPTMTVTNRWWVMTKDATACVPMLGRWLSLEEAAAIHGVDVALIRMIAHKPTLARKALGNMIPVPMANAVLWPLVFAVQEAGIVSTAPKPLKRRRLSVLEWLSKAKPQ